MELRFCARPEKPRCSIAGLLLFQGERGTVNIVDGAAFSLATTELEFAFCHICVEYHTIPHFYVWFDKFVFNSISLQLSIELGGQDWSNASHQLCEEEKK